jgi:hypothetical protein
MLLQTDDSMLNVELGERVLGAATMYRDWDCELKQYGSWSRCK